jgi:hypothetical protein
MSTWHVGALFGRMVYLPCNLSTTTNTPGRQDRSEIRGIFPFWAIFLNLSSRKKSVLFCVFKSNLVFLRPPRYSVPHHFTACRPQRNFLKKRKQTVSSELTLLVVLRTERKKVTLLDKDERTTTSWMGMSIG